MYDLREFIDAVEQIIKTHELETGAYQRWLVQDEENSRELGINPYGCADAANTLYTIGRFPQEPSDRAAWVKHLRELQDPKTGFFFESTHHEIHTTAHCIAALELFDALPAHSLHDLAPYKDIPAMLGFLDQLDWVGNPWGMSHRGAGLYAALVLAGEVDLVWQDAYFKWVYDETDPQTGFLRKDCIKQKPSEHDIFPHLAGSFHYLFNQEYAHQALPFPQAMVDSCIEIWQTRCFPLAENVGFAEIDWVFCLTRALRQCGHRRNEAMQAIEEFTEVFIGYLLKLDPQTDDQLNDLHRLFGMSCCLAELQASLPGQLKTERPLKLVLDRRPFI